MKNLFLSLLLAPTMLLAQTGKFHIDGTATGTNVPRMVYLMFPPGSGLPSDSTVIKDGKFSFSGEIDGIEQAMILFDHGTGGMRISPDSRPDMISVILSNESFQITTDGPIATGVVTGSKHNDEVRIWREMSRQAQPSREGGPNLEAMAKAVKEFVTAYPKSYAAISPMNNLVMMGYDKAELQNIFELMDVSIREHRDGKQLASRISGASAGQPTMRVGAPAVNFTLTDMDGNKISLSDYRGKFLLLDFWGSWCAPCRASNPKLVEFHNKYKDRQFDILGLANERTDDEIAWRKAIEDDGIDGWKHVNLKTNGNGSDVLTAYNVRAFPTKILISPNGAIAAIFVGASDELGSRLQQIFGF